MLYAWRKSDTTDPEFVERRRAGLENFLLRVASHPRLCFDDQFINFLQEEHGWRETITDSGKLKCNFHIINKSEHYFNKKYCNKYKNRIQLYNSNIYILLYTENIAITLTELAKSFVKLLEISKIHVNFQFQE